MKSWPLLFAVLLILGVSAAAFAHPGSAIALGPDGRVYFVDTGGGVFEIGLDGQVKRLEGPAFHWFAIDPASRFAKTNYPSIPGSEIRSVGLHPTLVLSSDFPVAIGRDGALYYPERSAEQRWRIVRLTPEGTRSVHATLPADIKPSGDRGWINGLVARDDGSLYYTHERVLRRISPRGFVSTIAADVMVRNCTRIPGVGTEAGPYLRGLDVAPDGTVYVAAAGCGAVLKITPTGQVTPVLRTISPYSPTSVAVSNGEIYVLEYLHTASDDRREWLARVRKVTRGGKVEILANLKR